jgi:predicted enzyme related to lactoylglutathione lyase
MRRMVASILAVVIDCTDSRSQAQFWADVLGCGVSERNAGEFEVGASPGLGTPLYFMNVPERKSLKNRVHIDITTDGPLQAEIDRLVEAGATLIELRQDPSEWENPDTWAVMHDPEGNEFCVLETSTVTGMSQVVR